MTDLSAFISDWGSAIEIEIKNRINLSAAAYAYEYMNQPIMSDGDFDALCLRINPQLKTGNKKLDKFFSTEFDPSTGMWIHKHPEKNRLRRIVELKIGN
jgi:hypothetical protein